MNQEDDIRKGIDTASLWRLLRYSLTYPRLLKEAGILLLLATLGQVLGPVLVKIFIDDYVTAARYPVGELTMLAAAGDGALPAPPAFDAATIAAR